MKDRLKAVIDNERLALMKLLTLLDEQHSLVMKNDVFSLEAMVDKIKLCNKEVAEWEVERRKVLNGKPMKEAIYQLDDEALEKALER